MRVSVKKYWNYSTAVVLMAFVVLLFNSGMRFSLGLLLLPMADSLQWSRTALSSMATVFMLVTAAALPFTGQLVDRLGAFRVLAFGIITAGIALVLTSQINQPWQGYAVYGVLFALASAATSITPIGVILSRAFPQRAGLANSLAISGMGVGQLLIVSVLAAWLATLGWRGAFFWLGVGSVVAMLPLLYWVYQLREPATPPATPTAPVVATTASGGEPATLTAALKLRPLWLMLLIYAICGFQDFFIATHIVAMAIDADVDVQTAGQMLALMGLAGLAGVLLAGVMADRYGPISVTVLCFVLRCALFVAMLSSQAPWLIVTAALLFGSTFWMTAPLTVIFARQLVGMGLLGAVSGVITMVHHGLGGLGAIYGAVGYDLQGSYTSGLASMLGLSMLALLLLAHPLLRKRQCG